jgi:prepilin-type N-terminal cleavage/methylation domain-containing protein
MKKRKAFSLVEILVVMALISLLTAILVPALGRARGQADVIVCRARLRELFLCSSLYAQENDTRLPVDPAMLGPSHENSRARNGGWIENSHRALMNLLLAQGASDEIFYCPSWKDERFTFSLSTLVLAYSPGIYMTFLGNPTKLPPFTVLSQTS